MKTCVSCHSVKVVADFYARDLKCKECRKAFVRAYRKKNIEKVRAYDRQRNDLPHRVAEREVYRKTPGGRERLNVGGAIWIKRNPEKRTAHYIVQSALRSGKLVRQPCACGNPKTEAHHEDYSLPLDVIWFCRRCHAHHHKAPRPKMPFAANFD